MAVFVILAAYFLGSVSFSVLIARRLGGIDIRAHGSGNAGATNMLRVLGPGPAAAVFALDVLKGVIPVLAAMWLVPGEKGVHMAAGLAAVAGHNWPVWFRFRGGKGIATTIGVVATLMFLPGLAAGALGILAIALTRYVSLGSLVFTGLLPFSVLAFDRPPEFLWGSVVIAVLAWYRHRGNLAKLVRGQENKLAFRRRTASSDSAGASLRPAAPAGEAGPPEAAGPAGPLAAADRKIAPAKGDEGR